MGFPKALQHQTVLEPWKKLSNKTRNPKKHLCHFCTQALCSSFVLAFSPFLGCICKKGLRRAACCLPGVAKVTLLDLCMNWKTSMGKHEIRTTNDFASKRCESAEPLQGNIKMILSTCILSCTCQVKCQFQTVTSVFCGRP